MKKHIDCGDPVDVLVKDYDDGLAILMFYRQYHNRDTELSMAKWVVEDVPFYFADDLIREEADKLVIKLRQLGAKVEIIV